MGTATKTFTENKYSSYKATWTLTMSRDDAIISGSSFSLNTPTLTAKYVYSGKKYGDVGLYGYMSIGGKSVPSAQTLATYHKSSSMVSGTTYSVTKTSSQNPTQSTEYYWNDSNPTDRTLPIVFHNYDMTLWSMVSEGDGYNEYTSTADWWWTVCNAVLDAPPTVSTPTVTKDTSSGWYAGLTIISVSVPISYSSSGTSATAKYGGYVSKIALTIGAQTLTKTYTSSTKPTSAQTLSFKLKNAGTFTPTVTITDSRGQSTSKSLSSITVQSYNAPSLSFDVFRSDSNGVKADEGTYGLISAKISYTSGATNIEQPTVKINGTTTSNVTWYSSYSSSNGVSGAITDWDNVSSGATVYGLINGSFLPTDSYQISLSAEDTLGSPSTTVTQTISTGFYTIDFQAGGKEIAFGAPANDNLSSYPDGLFKCNMSTSFTKDINTNGRLIAKATNIDLGTTPASNISTSKVSCLDNNGNIIASIYARQTASNESGLQFGGVRTVNGNEVYNLASSLISSTGTRSWSFSDPSAFRAGLGITHLWHYTSPAPTGYTFTANQYRKITVSLATTYSGFTPLIVRGQCTSHSAIRVFNYYIDGSSLVFEALSQSSSSISSANFAFTILWLNDTFF